MMKMNATNTTDANISNEQAKEKMNTKMKAKIKMNAKAKESLKTKVNAIDAQTKIHAVSVNKKSQAAISVLNEVIR